MVQTVTFTFGRDDNIKMKKGETLNIKKIQRIAAEFDLNIRINILNEGVCSSTIFSTLNFLYIYENLASSITSI